MLEGEGEVLAHPHARLDLQHHDHDDKHDHDDEEEEERENMSEPNGKNGHARNRIKNYIEQEAIVVGMARSKHNRDEKRAQPLLVLLP